MLYMDTTQLRNAYRGLLAAATTVLDSEDLGATPPPGEWNATQILGHIALVDAGTLATAYAIASGVNASYDNRTALDTWSIDRVSTIAGGSAGLMERIRVQGDALCALGEALTEAELDTPVPTLLLSAGVVQVDQLVPLRALITGLGTDHLPGHAEQLLALLPQSAFAAAAP